MNRNQRLKQRIDVADLLYLEKVISIDEQPLKADLEKMIAANNQNSGA